jgi:hypothetical protein
VRRVSKSLAWNDAELKMTIPSEMRDWARQLLTYEAAADKCNRSTEPAAFCAYEKLRRSLVSFAGIAAFQSIASRALVLAQAEVPSLCAVRIAVDGALQGWSDVQPISTDKDQAGSQRGGEDPPGEAGSILIARILSLLLTFLGEALTLSLLRNAWPDATFDDRNSGNGRRA